MPWAARWAGAFKQVLRSEIFTAVMRLPGGGVVKPPRLTAHVLQPVAKLQILVGISVYTGRRRK